MARYKVTKDQLERIVENFVMEASIESKKAPVKNMIPSQGAEAKKHVKNKMSGNMVDHSEGMPSVTPMKKKLSQASDAKKHMSSAKSTHNNKAKVVKEEEEMTSKPNPQEVMAHLKDILKKSDVGAIKAALEKKGIDSAAEAKEVAKDAVKGVNTDNMEDYMSGLEEGFMSKHKGKIGIALLAAALTGLGIVGDSQEHLINMMDVDAVIGNMLGNATWVASIVAGLAGLALSSSAAFESQKSSEIKSQIQQIRVNGSKAKAKGFTEELKDSEGNVFGLKNPTTGRTFPKELAYPKGFKK